MKLRRESSDNIAENSEEYKTAVKSVIRCQIQSLLQKLAIETGEESIVISTNISAGTYNHLGSFLGKEYLEDRDECVQSLCQNFTSFCTGLAQETQAIQIKNEETQNPEKTTWKSKASLPAPKSVSRKRPHDSQNLPISPPLKRRPDFLGNKEDISSQNCNSGKKNESSQVTWIKIEPVDDFNINRTDVCQEVGSKDLEASNEMGSLNNSIINRPTPLIPLASISKHHGINKVKADKSSTTDSNRKLPAEKSILRSLYENQPVFPLSTIVTVAKESDTPVSNDNKSDSTVSREAVDQYSSGASENLVLSGYYDSDSYPTYRHRQKHPANSQLKDGKKSKVKDKNSPQKTDVAVSSSTSIDFHLRTFESGGRLVYSCDVCKRELSHLTSYRRHMKLHTMERPHKCPVCDKGFIRKYHCIDHVNKHHKGVSFDPESLNLSEGFKPENPDQSALSESMDECHSEYNYTLDQSLDITDIDQNVNMSIDQSASNMLYKLAKSAAQDNQFKQSNESIYDENQSDRRSSESNIHANQSDDMEEDIEDQPEENMNEEEEPIDLEAEQIDLEVEPIDLEVENDVITSQSNNGVTSLNDEKGVSARKTEVTQGIKAIIAHLKNNKKKLVCDSNGAPQPVKVDNTSD